MRGIVSFDRLKEGFRCDGIRLLCLVVWSSLDKSLMGLLSRGIFGLGWPKARDTSLVNSYWCLVLDTLHNLHLFWRVDFYLLFFFLKKSAIKIIAQIKIKVILSKQIPNQDIHHYQKGTAYLESQGPLYHQSDSPPKGDPYDERIWPSF